jgi:hypothetical protein
VYEWLPFNSGHLEEVPAGDAARCAWLRERYGERNAALADRYRDRLIDRYGAAHGAQVRHAEAFEVSAYGAPQTPSVGSSPSCCNKPSAVSHLLAAYSARPTCMPS